MIISIQLQGKYNKYSILIEGDESDLAQYKRDTSSNLDMFKKDGK